MSQSGKSSSLWTIISSLGWPLIVGSAITAGFFALMYQGPLNLPIFHRYFAGHPVSMVETAFFFIGMVALAFKLADVVSQHGSLDQISIGDPAVNQPFAKCTELLDSLAALPKRLQATYLGRRYIDLLESVERKGTAEGIDAELKYLSDMDVGRQQDSYSLIRIIIWATPMLGFLGTVMGITEALGDLAKQDMSNLKGAMAGLLRGLYVAFDTTAIALSFSMVLMFIQFMIDRMEGELLSTIDIRVNRDLIGRFESAATTSDPNVAAIYRMTQSVLQVTEGLVRRQTEIWQSTIDAAHDHWASITAGTTQQLQTALSGALETSLQNHAHNLAQVEQATSEQMSQRWAAWQQTLAENARMLHAQQVEMVRQGEVMTQAIQATGNVIQLETALNSNLNALSGAKNFEDMVMSLSAAIHLLTARLGKSGEQASIELKASSPKGRAA